MVFMGKDDMVIMALPVKTLFSLYPLFEGFQADDAFDFESHIIKHHLYGRRGDLEIDEEVQINGNISSISLLGYINNSDPVGLVHFGILYLLETDAVEVSPADKEMKQGKFMCLSELEEICVSPDCTVEAWSQIALDPLKRYFASLQH